jgi:hypothetical protein
MKYISPWSMLMMSIYWVKTAYRKTKHMVLTTKMQEKLLIANKFFENVETFKYLGML